MRDALRACAEITSTKTPQFDFIVSFSAAVVRNYSTFWFLLSGIIIERVTATTDSLQALTTQLNQTSVTSTLENNTSAGNDVLGITPTETSQNATDTSGNITVTTDTTDSIQNMTVTIALQSQNQTTFPESVTSGKLKNIIIFLFL